MKKHNFYSPSPFPLEKGGALDGLHITYHTAGQLNEDQSNVIWVCHALTANSNPFEWWPGLFGPTDLFNPEDHFIVCANILGSCYGSTGPLSERSNGLPYFHDFPELTIRDMVNAHELLRKHLKINRINLTIGGSLGGHQALEWSILQPDLFDHLILIATNARHSPWGIAFNESQRMAIKSDHTWKLSYPEAGMTGMKAARSIALLSYRHYQTYWASQLDENTEVFDLPRAISYQQYQGEKLAKRFNAFSYWILSKAMDSHHVGRERNNIDQALKAIQAKTLVIGIQSDVLFPVIEQEFLAKYIPGATLKIIDSLYGHDGFLIETAKLTKEIGQFLKKNEFEQASQPTFFSKLNSS